MKVGAFLAGGKRRLGIVDDSAQTVRLVINDRACDLRNILGEGTSDVFSRLTLDKPLPLAKLTFLVPITPTRNIFCVGKNYRQHAREFNQSGFDATSQGSNADIDEFPAIFTKAPSSLVAHNAPIDCHAKITSQLDYEAELAVIIGKPGKGIRRATAYEHVWGYSIINDVTARDLQKAHRQWFMGKSLDTFCPMGPWITTAEEVAPENLTLECRVNGQLRQSASTGDLIFDIPSLIETISAGIALLPGDVIATGTPAGVGIGFDPPRFLKPGDEIEISISGLGMLKNVVQ